MFIKSFVLFCLVSMSFAQYYYEAENPEFEQNDELFHEHLPVIRPLRVRRQTVYGGLTPGNPGARATIGAQGNIFNNNGHSVHANGEISKNFKPSGPTGVGGGVNYQGPRAGVSGNVNHVHRFGTDVGVSGNANVWKSQNGRSSLDANAGYNRHFGGPGGTGRPNYNGNLNFVHRF